MKLTKEMLYKKKLIDIDETIEFDKKMIDNTSLVKAIGKTKINGFVKYVEEGNFVDSEIEAETELTLISKFSGKEYKEKVKVELNRTYTFDKESKEYDILSFGHLNLSAEIFNEIIYNIPPEKNTSNEKKGGKNWNLVKEDEFNNKDNTDKFDPRFAKLRKYLDDNKK